MYTSAGMKRCLGYRGALNVPFNLRWKSLNLVVVQIEHNKVL